VIRELYSGLLPGGIAHPPDLYLLAGRPGNGAPGRRPEYRKGAALWGGACPASMLRVRVIDLHMRAGSSGDDGVRFFLPVPGLALDLGDGGLVIAGLGVGSLRTCHALLGHRITSMFVRNIIFLLILRNLFNKD